MIKSLRLANFKAFAEAQHVPIRPITLIFGANSAGKSSILHSLLLTTESFQKNQLDVFKTGLGGDSVDLGGFKQYVHRADDHSKVSFSYELPLSHLDQGMFEWLKASPTLIVNLQIGMSQKEITDLRAQFDPESKETKWIKVPTGRYEVGSVPKVLSYEIATSEAFLLRMSRRPSGEMQMDSINDSHPSVKRLLEGLILSFTTTSAIQDADTLIIKEGLEKIIPNLVSTGDLLIPRNLVDRAQDGDSAQQTLFPVSKGTRANDLIEAMRMFLPRSLNSLLEETYRNLERSLGNLIYLGPLRSYLPRYLLFFQEHDVNWNSGGGHAWDLVLKNDELREQINEWLSDPRKLSTPYSLEVKKLYDLTDLADAFKTKLSGDELQKLRNEVSRLQNQVGGEYFSNVFKEILQGRKPKEWESDIPEDQAAKMNDQLIPIDIALNLDYSVDEFVSDHLDTLLPIVSMDMKSADYLTLLDGRSKTVVSHRDVGVGISQVLPVLAYSYANHGKMIAIEQPEIHLHPALQAELGDVFIESALGERKNTFLLETHSEHIILRILRRIRETTAGKNGKTPAIRPEDVSLLFVGPGKHGSEVQRIKIDERGRLIDRVPGGFFEEDFAELF